MSPYEKLTRREWEENTGLKNSLVSLWQYSTLKVITPIISPECLTFSPYACYDQRGVMCRIYKWMRPRGKKDRHAKALIKTLEQMDIDMRINHVKVKMRRFLQSYTQKLYDVTSKMLCRWNDYIQAFCLIYIKRVFLFLQTGSKSGHPDWFNY